MSGSPDMTGFGVYRDRTMQAQRSDMMWKPIAMAVGLALMVHAVFLLTDVLPAMLRAWQALFPRPVIEEPTRVEMVSMSPQQFEQNRKLAVQVPEPEPPPPPEQPPRPEQPRPTGQIVDLAPMPDSKPPIEARFLSEHNTRVERESVSPDRRPDYDKPKPRPTLAKADPRPKTDQPEPKPPEPAPPKPHEVTPESPKEPAEQAEPKQAEDQDLGEDLLAKVTGEPPGEPQIASQDDRADQPKPQGEPAPPGAASSQAVALAQAGDQAVPADEAGAPAPDHIRGVKTGSDTFLNSREYMYATFFNRLKRLVGQVWHPGVRDALERRDTIGHGPAKDELVTLVFVSLEPDGDLETVQLLRSSGLAVFDDLALRAFHDAAPFPNPPRGLIGPDGRIRFRFGFTISERYGAATHAFRPQRLR